jgi:rubrerythrin
VKALVAAAATVKPLPAPWRERYVCASCTYGVSRQRPPERCPMCGDHVWRPDGFPTTLSLQARPATA